MDDLIRLALTAAAAPVEDSDDADRLKMIIYALCQELQRKKAPEPTQ